MAKQSVAKQSEANNINNAAIIHTFQIPHHNLQQQNKIQPYHKFACTSIRRTSIITPRQQHIPKKSVAKQSKAKLAKAAKQPRLSGQGFPRIHTHSQLHVPSAVWSRSRKREATSPKTKEVTVSTISPKRELRSQEQKGGLRAQAKSWLSKHVYTNVHVVHACGACARACEAYAYVNARVCVGQYSLACPEPRECASI